MLRPLSYIAPSSLTVHFTHTLKCEYYFHLVAAYWAESLYNKPFRVLN